MPLQTILRNALNLRGTLGVGEGWAAGLRQKYSLTDTRQQEHVENTLVDAVGFRMIDGVGGGAQHSIALFTVAKRTCTDDDPAVCSLLLLMYTNSR